ncbi:MAG: dTDP-4-dehydrorhamnose 3,5-epimerase [Bradyrhizobium sp.]|nr:dTDP-4-dehydrorhamnose 3,5-epimerase [Bradyrhizobium sp.]
MEFGALDLPGLLQITPSRFADDRGYFSETFRDDHFSAHAGKQHFVQDNQSLSTRSGTIRGLHFQTSPHAQGKLVRCIAGALFDVAVDLRHGSPGYGKWAGLTLSSDLGNQLWIPPGFAHGFCTLVSDTIISYKVTAYYSAADDRGLAWDDPDIAIDWPDIAESATLSAKDMAQPALHALPRCFLFED